MHGLIARLASIVPSAQFRMFSGNIAHWSVFSLCALLPFFFIPTAWVSVVQAKMLLVLVFVLIATLSWVATVLSEGSIRIPRSWLLLAGALVPVAYFVSALATGASPQSFIGSGEGQDTVVATAIWYALFVACTYIFSAGTHKLVSFTKALVVGGAFVLVIQIIHLVFPSFTFGGALVPQAASVIGSWHDLAIFLGLLFFLSLALLPTPLGKERLWKFFCIGIVILSFLLLIIANFSDVWLGLSILAALYGAYLWYRERARGYSVEADSNPSRQGTGRASSRQAYRWIGMGIVFLGLYFWGGAVHGALPGAIQVTHLEVRPSWAGTLAIGERVFAQPGNVFFGSGPNTFPREWGMYKPLSVNATQFWNVDFYSGVGFIPTSFVTVGLLGILAWGAVCLALLWSVWRMVRRREDTDSNAHAPIFIVGAAYLTAFLVLYVPGAALSALAFIFFGAVVASELLSGSIKSWTVPLSLDSWKGRVGASLLLIFAFVVLFASVQSLRVLSSDMFVNRAVALYNETGDFSRAGASVSTALAIRSANDRAHRAAVELGLLQLAQLAASGDASEEARAQLQNTLTLTIQHGVAAVEIEGGDYQNWLSLARLYGELAGAGVEGAVQVARSAYEAAQSNNPTNPIPFLGLAQIDLLEANDVAARAHLASALAIKQDFAAALFLLSQIDARANKLPLARASAEAVVRAAPDDPLGWYNLGTIYYAQGEYANAAASFERAVGIENSYANALFLLSASYAALGRFEDAAIALRAVAALNPDNATLPGMITNLEARKNPFTVR